MPGFSGTGPAGMGPLTGRGRGYCVVPAGSKPGVGNYPVNAPYSYQHAYGRSYNLPYQYPNYAGRSSGYLGFFRGRGAGRAFPRGVGIRGRGRRF